MSVWDDYEAPESQGFYHTFEDGKTYRFRLISEPLVFVNSYTVGGKTTDSMKYAFVVWNVDAGIPQVVKLPLTVFKKIQSFAKDEEYGDPGNYDLKITRNGTSLKTVYEVIASPNKSDLSDFLDQLSEEDQDKISKIDLLKAIESGKGVSNARWLHEEVESQNNNDNTVVEDEKIEDEKIVKNTPPQNDDDKDW